MVHLSAKFSSLRIINWCLFVNLSVSVFRCMYKYFYNIAVTIQYKFKQNPFFDHKYQTYNRFYSDLSFSLPTNLLFSGESFFRKQKLPQPYCQGQCLLFSPGT